VGVERKEIAARVKDLRDIEEVSAETLCAELGFDPAEYKQWENCEADFPMGPLVEISNRFGVDLNALISGDSAKLRTFCVYHAGEAPEVSRRPQFSYHNLAYDFHQKRGEPFLVEASPDTENETLTLNTHPGQEFDYILEGRMFFSVSGKEMELGPGDSIYYNSLEPHGMKAVGGKGAKFLAIVIK
jgi:mannose-6-phosphate isomerase-like protein (cupin superfamily)